MKYTYARIIATIQSGLQPSFHNTVLYMSGGTYSLKSTLKSILNDRIFFEKFFYVYLLSEFLPEVYREESAEDIVFYISFYFRDV